MTEYHVMAGSTGMMAGHATFSESIFILSLLLTSDESTFVLSLLLTSDHSCLGVGGQ